MRQLVTVQKIKDIFPIEGADAIELVKVLGWYCVTKKGEFQVGDYCVYAEVDSVFPVEDPRFMFLESCKGRIKTKKMRGVYSQGICFHISILPADFSFEEGLEVTEILGVTQYVPKESVQDGDPIGSFPSHLISKSDETRVQILQQLLDDFKGTSVSYTEKLDGTSATYVHEDGEFVACSRNLRRKDGDGLYWEMARKYSIADKIEGFAIQGEIIGPGILSNKYKLTERDLFVFTVKDIVTGYTYTNQEVAQFCLEKGFKMVPVICEEVILPNDIDFWVELSKGKSLLNPSVLREGIVVRANEEVSRPRYNKLSFKVINPEWSAKYD